MQMCKDGTLAPECPQGREERCQVCGKIIKVYTWYCVINRELKHYNYRFTKYLIDCPAHKGLMGKYPSVTLQECDCERESR